MPLRDLAGLGEPLRQWHDMGLGQPAVDLGRLGRPAAGIRPGHFRRGGLRTDLLVFRPPVDLGEKLLFGGHAPAGEKLLHRPLRHADLPDDVAMPSPRRLQAPCQLPAPADRPPLDVEPVLEQFEMVEWRRLGRQLTLDKRLVDSPAKRREFLPLLPRLLGEPAAVVIEGDQRVAMRCDLPHLAGGESRGKSPVRQGPPPAAAGRRAGLHRPGQHLLRERHAVCEHVHGALTGQESLEPFNLGLRLGEPPLQRCRRIAWNLSVECTALGE